MEDGSSAEIAVVGNEGIVGISLFMGGETTTSRAVVAGGLFYTVGVICYASDHVRNRCHGVWHLFVLAGSTSHYIAILLYP